MIKFCTYIKSEIFTRAKNESFMCMKNEGFCAQNMKVLWILSYFNILLFSKKCRKRSGTTLKSIMIEFLYLHAPKTKFLLARRTKVLPA